MCAGVKEWIRIMSKIKKAGLHYYKKEYNAPKVLAKGQRRDCR